MDQRPRVYRKRPVAIEAMQWPGGRESALLVMNWARDHGVKILWTPGQPEQRLDDGTLVIREVPEHLEIPTLEGRMRAHFGDYIIRGVHGEFYPRKAAIFHETYLSADHDNEPVVRRAKAIIAQMVPGSLNGIQIHRVARALANAHMLVPPDTEPPSMNVARVYSESAQGWQEIGYVEPEKLDWKIVAAAQGWVQERYEEAMRFTEDAYESSAAADIEAAAHEEWKQENIAEVEREQTEAPDQEGQN